jgi:hypothetical protein
MTMQDLDPANLTPEQMTQLRADFQSTGLPLPPFPGGPHRGSSTAHSSSMASLGKRRPSRAPIAIVCGAELCRKLLSMMTQLATVLSMQG